VTAPFDQARCRDERRALSRWLRWRSGSDGRQGRNGAIERIQVLPRSSSRQDEYVGITADIQMETAIAAGGVDGVGLVRQVNQAVRARRRPQLAAETGHEPRTCQAERAAIGLAAHVLSPRVGPPAPTVRTSCPVRQGRRAAASCIRGLRALPAG